MKEKIENLNNLNEEYKLVIEEKAKIEKQFSPDDKVYLENILALERLNNILSDKEEDINREEKIEKFMAKIKKTANQELLKNYLTLCQQEDELLKKIMTKEQTDNIL